MSNTAISSNGADTAAAETKPSTISRMSLPVSRFFGITPPCEPHPRLTGSQETKLEAKLSAKLPKDWINVRLESPYLFGEAPRDTVILWLLDERARLVKNRGQNDFDVFIDGKYEGTLMNERHPESAAAETKTIPSASTPQYRVICRCGDHNADAAWNDWISGTTYSHAEAVESRLVSARLYSADTGVQEEAALALFHVVPVLG